MSLNNNEWNELQEKILKDWANKAICYQIMHEHSSMKYWNLNILYNIPIIIITTITGTSNFAVTNLQTYNLIPNYIIGSFNILAAILTSISSLLGNAQKIESHKISSISWDKLSRKIQLELIKKRKDRIPVSEFIRNISDDYDKLIEISPFITNDIIKWFKKISINNKLNNIEIKNNNNYNWCNYIFSFCCYPIKYIYIKINIHCCKNNKNNNVNNSINSIWTKIDLPDILGNIDIIQEKEQENDKLKKNNKYLLYNDNEIIV